MLLKAQHGFCNYSIFVFHKEELSIEMCVGFFVFLGGGLAQLTLAKGVGGCLYCPHGGGGGVSPMVVVMGCAQYC